ncbi:MAG TPA: hypothetical protein VMV27_08830 [Candidatus Binataceae bacterium]|nr:hypothetical protein [Candidatus Binataceae bacterium]
MRSTIRWMRAVLWILAAMYLVNGVAMFFFPSAWFFHLILGVPETGPYNMHLVMDSGTFFLGVGVGLIAGAIAPRRNAIAVLIAAVASTMHAALHLWSHAEGLLSWSAATTEIFGIYIPTLLLLAIAIALYRPDAPAAARAARAA